VTDEHVWAFAAIAHEARTPASAARSAAMAAPVRFHTELCGHSLTGQDFKLANTKRPLAFTVLFFVEV
jgi:hypothetical protein